MDSITFSPAAWSLAAVALLLGLLIGRVVWGGARSRADRLAGELAAERQLLLTERDARQRQVAETAAARDQVGPLADEVDRLRRENARLTRRAEAVPVAVADADDRVVPFARAAAGPAGGDLRQLKGVGDKLAARLTEVGVVGVGAMAGLSAADAARIDADLGPFSGRIARDQLVEQARLLVDGRVTEYEARFGRLTSSTT